MANSLVFLLIGMHEANQNFATIWLPAAVAVVFVILGRVVAVYPRCLLFARSDLRVATRHQHALLWGGLRGALALALALGLPQELPRRAEIITVSFAVVAFSIFVQGLTMPSLLRMIGEIPPIRRTEAVRKSLHETTRGGQHELGGFQIQGGRSLPARLLADNSFRRGTAPRTGSPAVSVVAPVSSDRAAS